MPGQFTGSSGWCETYDVLFIIFMNILISKLFDDIYVIVKVYVKTCNSEKRM